MEDQNGFNGATNIIEMLQTHTHKLEQHGATLAEMRAHMYKLDEIASNTGKLASSVENALTRVFIMLERKEASSRVQSVIVTGVLSLLLVILGLAATKFELQAGSSKDGHNISIKEQTTQ